MFQIWNSVFSATFRFEIAHPQAEQIFKTVPLKDYIDHHYDYMVRLKNLTHDAFGKKLVLVIYMERPWQNQARFVKMTTEEFLPSIKTYINYVLFVLHHFTEIKDWGTYHFEVQNLQKEMHYTPEQVGDGSRRLYQDQLESSYNNAAYLQSGIMPPED